MRDSKPYGLLMAAALMAASSPIALKPAKRVAHRPTPPRRDTALQREIADHNERVEAKRREKLERKRKPAAQASQKDDEA